MNKELLLNYLNYNTYDYRIIGNIYDEDGYNIYAIKEYSMYDKPKFKFLKIKDNIIYSLENKIIYKGEN